jgi:hypothetical protein
MVPLLEIVRDPNFKFSSNAATVTRTIKNIVESQTGVFIETYRDCPISLIGKILSTKFRKKNNIPRSSLLKRNNSGCPPNTLRYILQQLHVRQLPYVIIFLKHQVNLM